MSRYVSELLVRVWPPEKVWAAGKRSQQYELLAPLVYESDLVGLIEAPAGLVTDFASIPRVVWTIIDPEDPVILFPSVIHDFMYSVGSHLFARHQADSVLREAMGICGALGWQQAAVFRAVRLFGAANWRPFESSLAAA
jgi:hypothetical protein